MSLFSLKSEDRSSFDELSDATHVPAIEAKHYYALMAFTELTLLQLVKCVDKTKDKFVNMPDILSNIDTSVNNIKQLSSKENMTPEDYLPIMDEAAILAANAFMVARAAAEKAPAPEEISATD